MDSDAGGERTERIGVGHLHADEMVGAVRGGATRGESGHAAFVIQPHPAVAARLTIWYERERDERARCGVRVGEGARIEGGERIAVDGEKSLGANHRQRLART